MRQNPSVNKKRRICYANGTFYSQNAVPAMNIDDDDDFDFDDLNEEDWNSEDVRREMQEHHDRVHNMPLMKKAEEILHLTEAIVATINEDDDVLMVREQMMSNALIIMPKIAGAEGGNLYTLRMENAVIIKIHVRELLAQTSLVKAEKLANPIDLQILRNTIEEFRVLFVDWIKGFDKSNDIPDEWGLFYDA